MVIFNENLAKVAESYLKKGSKVYLEGQLQTRKWQDPSGQEKYTTEIVLQRFRGELTILDGRGGGGKAPRPASREAGDREKRFGSTSPMRRRSAPASASAGARDTARSTTTSRSDGLHPERIAPEHVDEQAEGIWIAEKSARNARALHVVATASELTAMTQTEGFRFNRVTRPAFRFARKAMPHMSATESEAIEAGDVWWDADIFTGNPDWDGCWRFRRQNSPPRSRRSSTGRSKNSAPCSTSGTFPKI